MSLLIAISSGALYPGTTTEHVTARARELGVDHVELMLQTTGEYDARFLRQVRQNADLVDVTIHSLHLFQPLHPLFTGYARRTDEAIDLFRRGVEGAAIAGAKLVVWHGPTRKEMTGDDSWKRFLAMTERLAEICAESDIVLGVENVSWCAISAVRDAIRFSAAIEALPHRRHIGYVFDSFQALEAGANPFMMLAAMEGRIANVHISDGVVGDTLARHRLPGDGEIPWPALIKAIAGAGYFGPMMLEAPIARAADVTRVRQLLDPLIAATGNTGDPCAQPLPDGVRRGIELFNAGEYYEAHEVIEHEWHAERGPIRAMYQGILQIGVGLHHTRGGNHRGAELLLNDGIEKVSRFLPSCQGVDTANLIQQSQGCLDQVLTLGPDRLALFDWSQVPQIRID